MLVSSILSRYRSAVFTLAFSICVYYSDGQDDHRLKRPIIIHSKQIRLDSLVKLISAATGLKFSYNVNDVQSSAKLQVPSSSLPVSKWLIILKENLNVDSKVLGDHMVLKRYQSKGIAASPAKTPKQNFQTGAGNSQNNISKRLAPPLHRTARVDTNVSKQKTDLVSIQSITSSSSNAKEIKDTAIQVEAKDSSSNDTSFDSRTTTRTVDNANQVVDTSLNKRPDITAVTGPRANNRGSVSSYKGLEMGLQGLGATFEIKATGKTAVNFSGGIGGIYYVTDKLQYFVGIYQRGAYFSINPRLYNQGVKDERHGNDGSYFGATVKYVHDLTKVDFIGSVFLFNIHWGINKSLSRRFLLNGHVGPGYVVPVVVNSPHLGITKSQFYPSLNFKILYSLGLSRSD